MVVDSEMSKMIACCHVPDTSGSCDEKVVGLVLGCDHAMLSAETSSDECSKVCVVKDRVVLDCTCDGSVVVGTCAKDCKDGSDRESEQSLFDPWVLFVGMDVGAWRMAPVVRW